MIAGRRQIRQRGRRLPVQSRVIVVRACLHTAVMMTMMMMMIAALPSLAPAGTMEIALLATGVSPLMSLCAILYLSLCVCLFL